MKRPCLFLIRATAYALSVYCLTACQFGSSVDAGLHQAQAQQTRLSAWQRDFVSTRAQRQRREQAQDVAQPWLAGAARVLSPDEDQIALLHDARPVTLLLAQPAGLRDMAQALAAVTGLSVRVQPEALLPASQFMPRLHVPSHDTGSSVVPDTPALSFAGLTKPQPLPVLLDAIAAHFSVYWRAAHGEILFYRTRTRVFDVHLLTLAARADAQLGRAPKAQSGGFDNISSTRLATTQADPLKSLTLRIEPLLTQAGVVVVMPGAGASVVVTDTPLALARVDHFLQMENRAATRRVRLVLEEITVMTHNSSHLGIDWAAVYQQAKQAASLATVPGVATQGLAMRATRHGGAANGTRFIIDALAQQGTVVRHTSIPLLTLNRRPVTHTVRTTFSYVDQVRMETTDTSVRSHPAVSVQQKEETTGVFVTLLPDVQSDGQILLSVAYDNTMAQPLRALSFGGDDDRLQIQQATIDGNGTIQQVALDPQQALIIAGFERRQDDYQKVRPVRHWPIGLGGQDDASVQRLTTVLVVTADIEEGTG